MTSIKISSEKLDQVMSAMGLNCPVYAAEEKSDGTVLVTCRAGRFTWTPERASGKTTTTPQPASGQANMLPVTAIPGVGPATAKKLSEYGFDTVQDLLDAPEEVRRDLLSDGQVEALREIGGSL